MTAVASQSDRRSAALPLAKWTRVGYASTNAVFNTLTVAGSVFILYMDELQMNRVRIGLLLSLIPLCGIIAPFIAKPIAGYGVKRVACTFYTLRKLCVAMLVFTPVVLSYGGSEAAFLYTAACVMMFALSRAICETAIYPWDHEAIPNAVRGKLNAVINVVSTIAGLCAVAIASVIIRNGSGLTRFQILIVIGSLFGLISAGLLWRVPGGAPIAQGKSSTSLWRDMLNAARDKTFVIFLAGFGLTVFGISLFFPFAALYLKDIIGIRPGNVVLLEVGVLAGGFITAYFWGWAADRYGGKPPMLVGGYWMVMALLLWHIVPRESGLTGVIAATAIGFVTGIFNIAWGTGYLRLMFVAVVPPDRRTTYLALFYAVLGISGAAGPFVAGNLLEGFRTLDTTLFGIHFNSFTPLMLLSGTVIILGLIALGLVRSDGRMAATQFVGMFLQGNPLVAIDSLIRYNFVRSEMARVQVVERLGKARSPLNVDELIEALGDVSFNVRYEVIVTIARTRPDPRLAQALIDVVRGNEPELAIAAAWALSRLGDRAAIPALREAAHSPYPLLATQAARSLGTLGDFSSIPLLLDKFRQLNDPGLQLGYASALGALEAHEAMPELLLFLAQLEDPPSRNETAMAIARAIGPELYFIELTRAMRADGTTALAAELTRLARRMRTRRGAPASLAAQTARAFADGDDEQGIVLLLQTLRALPEAWQPPVVVGMLREIDQQIAAYGLVRPEYIQLAVHAMDGVTSAVALGQYSKRMAAE